MKEVSAFTMTDMGSTERSWTFMENVMNVLFVPEATTCGKITARQDHMKRHVRNVHLDLHDGTEDGVGRLFIKMSRASTLPSTEES